MPNFFIKKKAYTITQQIRDYTKNNTQSNSPQSVTCVSRVSILNITKYMEQNTLLDQNLYDEPDYEHEYASSNQRFGNYLIDQIVLYLLSSVGGFVLGLVAPAVTEEELRLRIVSFFISVMISIAYYTLMEGGFGGKTIGKMITRTHALREDGEQMDIGKSFVRSLCRFIPFDPFSFLGSSSGWHDSVSKTMVVKDRR